MKNEQFKKYSKKILEHPLYIKYQIYITPAISLLLSIILLTFVTIPQFLSAYTANDEITSIKQKTDMVKTKIQALKSININEYKTYQSTALKAMPPEQDISGAVEQLTVLSRTSGLKLDGISFGPVQPEGPIQSFSIKLDLSGSVTALKDFTLGLNDLTRITKVDSIEVTSFGDSSKVQAGLNTITFFQTIPQSLGSTDQSISLLSADDKNRLANIKASIKTIDQSFESGPIISGKTDPFQ